jgi:2-polyprenyl-6-methoxyphenol hydroxylase-like FAD-dependent oxidoreductase
MRVLVVGGGITGMCMAISLARAGLGVELVEADPDWRALGAGLSLNGASLRALGRLGVLDEVMALGACGNARRLYDGSGRLIRVVNTPNFYGVGVPNIGGILRPVLHGILQRATRATGVAIRLGVEAVDSDDTGADVEVRLSDGTSARCGFVIAADGFASRFRQRLFPNAPAPVYSGQAAWRVVAARPPVLDGTCMYMGRQMVGVNPVSTTELYLFLLQLLPEKTRIEPEQWLPRLHEQLAEFGGMIAEIRAGLGPESQINYRPLEYFVLPRPWHRGRVLLAGDAVHATTPHGAYGAGLGVEDALILGDLVQAGLRPPELFTRFTERRFDRCNAVVRGSVRLGELEIAHATPEAFAAATADLHAIIMTAA